MIIIRIEIAIGFLMRQSRLTVESMISLDEIAPVRIRICEKVFHSNSTNSIDINIESVVPRNELYSPSINKTN